MSKLSSLAKMEQPTTLKSLLETFERTIDENNRVGVNSGMYLNTNVSIKQSSTRSNSGSRKDLRNEGRKTMSSVSILATLDEMTDLADAAIYELDSNVMDHSLHRNRAAKEKPFTHSDDSDEMSITSFHSGSRKASSIMSRPISIGSDTEGGGCGVSTTSSRSKNSTVARSSARIRELPRDIQIRSCDYDTTDDDSSDSDSGDDEHPTSITSRYW